MKNKTTTDKWNVLIGNLDDTKQLLFQLRDFTEQEIDNQKRDGHHHAWGFRNCYTKFSFSMIQYLYQSVTGEGDDYNHNPLNNLVYLTSDKGSKQFLEMFQGKIKYREYDSEGNQISQDIIKPESLLVFLQKYQDDVVCSINCRFASFCRKLSFLQKHYITLTPSLTTVLISDMINNYIRKNQFYYQLLTTDLMTSIENFIDDEPISSELIKAIKQNSDVKYKGPMEIDKIISVFVRGGDTTKSASSFMYFLHNHISHVRQTYQLEDLHIPVETYQYDVEKLMNCLNQT